MTAPAAVAVALVAHRGDPYRRRENTLPSLRSAVAAGADAVEVDVRLTADGYPVLLHDATLQRLWGLDRRLSAVPWHEVRRRTDDGVPLLTQALRTTAATRTLLDLPDPAAARPAVAEVHALQATDRVWYCGGPAAMREVREADPDAEIALTWHRAAPPRASLLAELRPRWLNYRFGLLTPALVQRALQGGYRVSAWTADTGRTFRRLRAMGVHAVTTNRVGTLHRLR